jgi:predicted RNase H-like nuclease (RuvC/YqgF family)
MDATQIVVSALLLLGGAAAATAITSFARRKHTQAETDSIVVEAATKVVEMQQETVDRTDRERRMLEEKLNAAFRRIDELQASVIQLQIAAATERAECDAKISVLQTEIANLRYHQAHPLEFPNEHPPSAGD